MRSLLFAGNVNGQISGDFCSKPAGTGNWNDYNAWQIFDGTTWLDATTGQLPIATSDVEIQAGHAMIINAPSLAAKNLNINGSLTYIALTAAIITATGTNSITVTGSLPASVTGGSATSYVIGPLIKTIPGGAAAANCKFPVGSAAYQLFEYAGITTGGTGNATFTAEAFDTGPYDGTAGTGLSTINTSKYWSLSASLESVTITSSSVRLTDEDLVSTNKKGQSNRITNMVDLLIIKTKKRIF